MEAADEAETEEQGSSGTMKIAIALALVGGTVWLVKKNKKSGAKKKGATAAKKTTSTSSFALGDPDASERAFAPGGAVSKNPKGGNGSLRDPIGGVAVYAETSRRSFG